MKNGIIGAFFLLLSILAGIYFGYKISDNTFVEIDGEYFTRYEVQKLLDEMEQEEVHA